MASTCTSYSKPDFLPWYCLSCFLRSPNQDPGRWHQQRRFQTWRVWSNKHNRPRGQLEFAAHHIQNNANKDLRWQFLLEIVQNAGQRWKVGCSVQRPHRFAQQAYHCRPSDPVATHKHLANLAIIYLKTSELLLLRCSPTKSGLSSRSILLTSIHSIIHPLLPLISLMSQWMVAYQPDMLKRRLQRVKVRLIDETSWILSRIFLMFYHNCHLIKCQGFD